MKYRGLKRALSGVLAGVMLLSCTSGAVVSFAAGQYNIKFIADDPDSTEIIEGGVVNAQATLPPGHTFDETAPFKVGIKGKDANGNEIVIAANPGLITISRNTINHYAITANTGAAFGNNTESKPIDPRTDEQETYTLEPNLTAKLTDGIGTLNVEAGTVPDDEGKVSPPGFYSTKVKSLGNALAIIADSSFSFTATDDETTDGNINFSKTSGGTGLFAGMEEQITLDEPITTSGNRKILKVNVGGRYNFEISVTMSANMIITKDSKFTVSYKMQQIDPLILSVITPQRAVNQTAESIRVNPIDPLVPDKHKIPYVRLATGDTLSSITTNFDVLHKVERYNSKDPNMIKIKWSWVADADEALPPNSPPQFQDVVDFGPDGRRTQQVRLNPRTDDVKGKLYAEVSYLLIKPISVPPSTIVETVTTVKIPVAITVLGTGVPPELRPSTQTVGQGLAIGISSIPTNMDVYDGKLVATPPKPPNLPHSFIATMLFGSGRGRAEKTVIRATGTTPDAIEIYVDNGPTPYVFGEDITNKDQLAGQMKLEFKAVKDGQVTLHFDYYVRNNKGQLVVAKSSESFTIVVSDTTPRDFKQLSSLIIQSPELERENIPQYPGGIIGYGFKAETYSYSNVEIPHTAATINISPSIPPNRGTVEQIHYAVTGGYNSPNDPIIEGDLDLAAGKKTIGPIPMNVENPRTVTLTVTAENGTKQLYILTINRMPASRDSSLKTLTVTDDKGVAILKGFSPTQLEYSATVPYSTRWAKFVIEPNDPWATGSFVPMLIPGPGSGDSKPEWVKLGYKGDASGVGSGFDGVATTKQKITVNAQDPATYPGVGGGRIYTTDYTVKITRSDPSRNNFASQLTIKDHRDRPVNFDGGAKFDKNVKNYFIHIPYSAEKLSLSILPEDILALSVKVTCVNGKGETVKETPYEDDDIPLLFTVDTPVESDNIGAANVKIIFTVKAESGDDTTPPYVINVVRNDPDLDDTLTSLTVNDQNDAPVKTFSFNPQTQNYTFTVPFVTEQVRVKPVPRSELATVKVNGTTIDTNTPYHRTDLKAGETKNIKVEIFPEAKGVAPREYNLSVTRELPSSDARLKELVVNGGEDFRPRFAPNTTTYQVKIPEGTKTVTFTPTPLAIGATITVNGIAVEGGKPSEPYEPYEPKSEVKIEVTAQDGTTKMTYTISVINQNLIPKSSNADLASLEIREGSMSPRFKPSITEYEVAVKDDISSVDILPVTRSEEATIKVSCDSKELGDYYDRYSTFIRDGENVITVEVTAENGVKKSYNVTVFRKDEEKQLTYKPVTADMVDFTTNPIVVDISRYTVIAAEVFNTLKEDYPEKTMVFEGNDYSLQLTGKDMDTLVPHAATYDLGLTFSSPNEDAIWSFIYSHPRNDNLEPVFIHFNHHGALPGKMLFTISLGRSYRTQNATWNYYNEERDRIDYYGGVRTNSRGTFTVPITHMSTYIYSEERIDGAENKSGEFGQTGIITSGSGKPNPNTGVGGQK